MVKSISSEMIAQKIFVIRGHIPRFKKFAIFSSRRTGYYPSYIVFLKEFFRGNKYVQLPQ